MQLSPICRQDYDALVAVVKGTCHLPAVATLDWADRAAEALVLLSRPSRACVVVATVDNDGSVREHETAGVATSTASGVVRHEATADRSPELTLRSRAERLDHVGAALHRDALDEGIYGTLDRILHASDWRSVGLGRIWAGVPAGEVLTGIVRLGDVAPGRVMIAMIGLGHAEDDATRERRVAMMSSVLPGLAERAVLAMGAAPTNASRWLTLREQEVLRQLTLGKSVRQIAEEIGRSPHTVHDHVKSLHRKLHASSRGELVARALGFLDERHNLVAEGATGEGPITEVKATAKKLDDMRRPAGQAPAGAPSEENERPAVYIPSRSDAPSSPQRDEPAG